jgi:DNA polymerase-1
VGDKTARKFLKEYGSLENLLANTDKLQGKMKEKIEENAELGLLSKKLATIITDCPVEFHEKDFELNSPDVDKITTIFQELEFRRLLENVHQIFSQNKSYTPPAGQEPEVQPVPNYPSRQLDFFSDPVEPQSETDYDPNLRSIDAHDHLYQSADTITAHRLLVSKLLKQQAVCFDTETTSLNSLTATLVGIAFSYEKGKGYYAVMPEDQEATQQILEIYRPFFENEGIVKVGQNLKYDIKVLDKYAIRVKGSVFDTMIAHYLLNPDMRHNMDILAETYLNYQPIPIENLIGKKGKNQGTMREVPLDLQTEYAVEDADITWQLYTIFSEQLKKDKLTRLYEDIEAPLIKVLADMEIEGIRMDEDVLSGLSVALTEDIKSLEKKIYGQAKTEFNLASPKQLGTVLFEELKLVDKPTKTKTGQYGTGEEILSKLAFKHPIVAEILEWRGLVKLKNTYVDSLPNEVNKKTGRIHTTYSQAVASTGRLSSNNPNLQNIPIRTERGKEIRKAFVPRNSDYLLLSADYSQIELRLIAELSGDEELKTAFLRGEDIHRSTASKVFNVPLELVSREQRSYAKTVNFGIIYGVSAFGLSQQTDLSQKESKELIDTYFRTYPGLKNYIQSQIDFARRTGYVETILGRRRYLKNINSANAVVRAGDERNAVNAPIQGSAADIIKIAMIRIHEQLEKEKLHSKMILQVHDELVFDVLKEEMDFVMPLVKQAMENAYPLSIPLIVDAGAGENWLEAH